MTCIPKPSILIITVCVLFQSIATGQLCTTREAYAKKAKTKRIDQYSTQCVAENFFLWDVKNTIRVRFLNGPEELHERVMKIAHEWEKYANIKFLQTQSETSEIRIGFSSKNENYTFIGTDALQVDTDLPNMEIELSAQDDSIRLERTVLHLFGHVLGLLHEHKEPGNGLQWNKDTVYKHYAQLGWDIETTEKEVFDLNARQYSNGLSYDSASIMHTSIAKWQTTDGYEKPWNNQISEGDKLLAGLMYPFNYQPGYGMPKAIISHYTTTRIKADKAGTGLNFYPSFKIKTSGATGDIYFAVVLYDKEGYPIKSGNQDYNLDGVVSSYKILRLGPRKNISVNKSNPEEFTLFLPYDCISDMPENNEIQVIFKVFVINGTGLKSIFISSPVTYLIGKINDMVE
jgi:Astacin (Peptidase family M12A)